tara:strand:- start:1556 stop:2020 length:465 start_codon:yes stop_codon:yes gene_type:complete
MTDSAALFVGISITVIALWIALVFRGVPIGNVIDYFKKNSKIFSGIKFAIIFSIFFVAVGYISGCSTSSGTYLNSATVYSGIDYSLVRPSPQCTSEGVDDRSTSNLGLKVNLFTSTDRKYKTNLKYTHHSCAFNPDQNLYDAVGIEFEYGFWER